MQTVAPEQTVTPPCGADVCLVDGESGITISKNIKNIIHLASVILLLIAGWILGHTGLVAPQVSAAVSLAAVSLGYPIYIKAVKSLIERKIGVALFVTIAEIASVSIGEFFAAGTVVAIILAGTYLEDYILDKTRGAIRKLVEMTPKTARLIQGELEVDVNVSQLKVGDLVLVKPGERIPVDGKILVGNSAVDQSPITGEAVPVDKSPGCSVFTGTLNQNGALKVEMTKLAADTTLAHMIHLVEEAQEKKAPIQNVADRFTTYFLPAILLLAGAVYLAGGSSQRAVTVLLVACPCAMSLAVPIAVVGAIGNAGRRGILIKGGAFVELLRRADAVVFDKTGTLTYGKLHVVDIVGFNGHDRREVLETAAVAEQYSEHPLGRAILDKATEDGISAPAPEHFEAKVGHGVVASHDGHTIRVGQAGWMEKESVAISTKQSEMIRALEGQGATVLLVSRGDQLIGAVAESDVIRKGVSQEIDDLRALGIRRVAIVSGDSQVVSEAVGRAVGITEVMSRLLPEEKVAYIERLRQTGHTVVMVGDGINDAPALASADIGMAMGTAGSAVAIEAADVSLLGDDLSKIKYVIGLSRSAFWKMRANIAFAIAWNVVGLTMASLGYLTPVIGAVLQEAGCISVVINSSLLLFYQGKGRRPQFGNPGPQVSHA